MIIETALEELAELLAGLNYVVSLDLYCGPELPRGTARQYVKAAIGPQAVLGGAVEVSVSDMLAEVEGCLRWRGTGGAYPDRTALRSPRMKELVAAVREHLTRVAAESKHIRSFWLTRGHPHGPVIFWDFGFILAGPEGSRC